MDISPWSSKNLIDRNRFKKFMQVGLDVTCMYTDFGGCSLSSFGDNITSQKRPNFPLDISPWSSKNLIDRNRLKKYMQVDLDVTCMYTDFGERGLSSLPLFVCFLKRAKISLWTMSYNIIGSKYSGLCEMHANQFWWVWFFWFWRFCSFPNSAKVRFRTMGDNKYNRLKKFMIVEVAVFPMLTLCAIQCKIHASLIHCKLFQNLVKRNSTYKP